MASLEPPELAAAETLNVENLPKDATEFRRAVDQIIKKVDVLLSKLKEKPEGLVAWMNLVQTRDNVLREIEKLDAKEGAKWSAAEARTSVELMLKLLKEQYEKAADLAG
jgi:hypothetical protein